MDCRCNLFIILDGYTICSNCGWVLESRAAEGNFTPIGYQRISKKESKQRKKFNFKEYYLKKYDSKKFTFTHKKSETF